MRNIFQEYYDLGIERIIFSFLYNSCIFNDFSSPDIPSLNFWSFSSNPGSKGQQIIQFHWFLQKQQAHSSNQFSVYIPQQN